MPRHRYAVRGISRAGGTMLLPDAAPDGRIYLTSAQAAEITGVKPAAVRRWEHIGYLESAPGTSRRKLYEYTAVLRAERLAREAAIRTSGSDTRVQRRHLPASA